MRWLISTIFTIIVVAVVLYFFKFSIRGDALCISLRHKEHKEKLEKVTHKVEKELMKSKEKLKEKVKEEIKKGVIENNPSMKKGKNNVDKNGLKKVLQENQ